MASTDIREGIDKVQSLRESRRPPEAGLAEAATPAMAAGAPAAHSGAQRLPHWLTAYGVPALLVAALVLLPFVLPRFTISTLTQILAFAVLCLSLHLLMGWTGIMSLGQAAYFGVAAYAVGQTALQVTTSAPILLLVGAGAGALAAALTGWFIVRSSGGYLLMITIAIGELFARAAQSWRGITGGDDGLARIPFTTLGGLTLIRNDLYWYALAVFVACLCLLYLVGGSPFGRTLRGIRDNEPRMRSLGYSTLLCKYAAFCLAGAIAGLAGAVWIAHAQFVSPHDMGIMQSTMVLVAVVIGGMDRLWGSLCGAAIVILSQNMLPAFLEGQGPLVLGALLIAVVYVLPGGLTALTARFSGVVRRGG